MSETPQDHEDDAPIEAFDTDDTGDFAAEHDEPTFAEELPGGPEGAREDASPSGLAGAD